VKKKYIVIIIIVSVIIVILGSLVYFSKQRLVNGVTGTVSENKSASYTFVLLKETEVIFELSSAVYFYMNVISINGENVGSGSTVVTATLKAGIYIITISGHSEDGYGSFLLTLKEGNQERETIVLSDGDGVEGYYFSGTSNDYEFVVTTPSFVGIANNIFIDIEGKIYNSDGEIMCEGQTLEIDYVYDMVVYLEPGTYTYNFSAVEDGESDNYTITLDMTADRFVFHEIDLNSNNGSIIGENTRIHYYRFELLEETAISAYSEYMLPDVIDMRGFLLDEHYNIIETDLNGGDFGNFRFNEALEAGTYYIVACFEEYGFGSFRVLLDEIDNSEVPNYEEIIINRDDITEVDSVIRDGEINYFTFEFSNTGVFIFEIDSNLELEIRIYNIYDELIYLDIDESASGVNDSLRIFCRLDPGRYNIEIEAFIEYPLYLLEYTLFIDNNED